MRKADRSWLWIAGVVVLSMFLAGNTQAATIQGQIAGFNGTGYELLNNQGTFAAVFQGKSACDAKYVGYGILGGTGGYTFTVSDLLPTSGDTKYFVKSWSDERSGAEGNPTGGRVNYVDTWYGGTDWYGTYDCTLATGYELGSVGQKLDIGALVLQKGDYISGTVTSPNGNTYSYTNATGTYEVANTYILVMQQQSVGSPPTPTDGCNSPIYSIATTDKTSGKYTTDNLPAGTYYLKTYSFQLYSGQWWENKSNCNQATTIVVSAGGNEVSAKDFSLTKSGATISGNVSLLDGTVGPANSVADIMINVYEYNTTPIPPTNPCHQGKWVATAYVTPSSGSFSSGTYTTPRLEPGDYMLQSYSTLGTYGNEYANASWSVPACGSAEKIKIETSVNQSGKNFQLNAINSMTISGTVYDANNGTAIKNKDISINVFKYVANPVPADNECHQGEYVTTATVDKKTGTYTTPFLTSGDYLLQSYSKDGYFNEWYYTQNESKFYCKDATKIPLTTAIAGANFHLTPEDE